MGTLHDDLLTELPIDFEGMNEEEMRQATALFFEPLRGDVADIAARLTIMQMREAGIDPGMMADDSPDPVERDKWLRRSLEIDEILRTGCVLGAAYATRLFRRVQGDPTAAPIDGIIESEEVDRHGNLLNESEEGQGKHLSLGQQL